VLQHMEERNPKRARVEDEKDDEATFDVFTNGLRHETSH